MQYSKPELEELGSIFALTNTAAGSGMGSVPPISKKKRPPREMLVSDEEMMQILEADLESE